MIYDCDNELRLLEEILNVSEKTVREKTNQEPEEREDAQKEETKKESELALHALLNRTFLAGKVKNPPRIAGILMQTKVVFIKITVFCNCVLSRKYFPTVCVPQKNPWSVCCVLGMTSSRILTPIASKIFSTEGIT